MLSIKRIGALVLAVAMLIGSVPVVIADVPAYEVVEDFQDSAANYKCPSSDGHAVVKDTNSDNQFIRIYKNVDWGTFRDGSDNMGLNHKDRDYTVSFDVRFPETAGLAAASTGYLTAQLNSSGNDALFSLILCPDADVIRYNVSATTATGDVPTTKTSSQKITGFSDIDWSTWNTFTISLKSSKLSIKLNGTSLTLNNFAGDANSDLTEIDIRSDVDFDKIRFGHRPNTVASAEAISEIDNIKVIAPAISSGTTPPEEEPDDSTPEAVVGNVINTTSIGKDAEWLYLDDYSLTADDDWTSEGFDTSAWKTGVAPFGYDVESFGASVYDIAVSTPLAGCDGENTIPTYYFRSSFVLGEGELSKVTKLVGSIEYDDAVAIYLNGTKIATYGKTGGTFDYATKATTRPLASPIMLDDASTLAALKEGVNTVAVELHTSDKADVDAWFRLTLSPIGGLQKKLDEFTVWNYWEREAGASDADPAGDSLADGYNRLSWTYSGYDYSKWEQSIAPFGSKNGRVIVDKAYDVATTLLDTVDGKTNTAAPEAYFFRTNLYISPEDMKNIMALNFEMTYDDAALVYVNGVKVAEYYNEDKATPITGNIQYTDVQGAPINEKFTVSDISGVGLHEGNNVIAVELHQASATDTDIWLDLSLDPVLRDTKTVNDDSLWQYLDDGSITSGTEWTETGFDASGWKSGSGPFGSAATLNGVAARTTLLGCNGISTNSTYLFRTQFTLDKGAKDSISRLVGVLQYDDAAAIYLNGVKIYETDAISDSFGYAGTDSAYQCAVPLVISDNTALDALVEGENTIAVEVHTSSATDADMWVHLNLAPRGDAQEDIGNWTVWQYSDDGTDPAGSSEERLCWTESDYDTSGWKTGVGPFGNDSGVMVYDGLSAAKIAGTYLEGVDADAATDSTPAYFFCTNLYISEEDYGKVGSFIGNITFDDAAIVYLNGVKIFEGYNSSVAASITDNLQYIGQGGTPSKTEFVVGSPKMLGLNAGNNIIAVELHQDAASGDDIWFDLELEARKDKVDAISNIVMTPGADETQMGFTWYAPSSWAGRLFVAKYDDLKNGAMPDDALVFDATAKVGIGGDYSNTVVATGLEKGVKYAYQIDSGSLKSEIYSFTTGDGGTDFNFGFVADIQVVHSANSDWKNNLKKMTDNFEDMSFILSAGDQVNEYNNGIDKFREEEYDSLLDHEQMKNIPFVPTIGNHDNDASFRDHYEVPNSSEEYGLTSTNSGGDYYFVYNGVLFLNLNSNNKSAAEHRAFMEQAIEETENAGLDIKWKVVVLHHGFYSVSLEDGFDRSDLRTTFMPAFQDLDIDVMLSGHDHVYSRSYMLDSVDHPENIQYDSYETFDDVHGEVPTSVTNPSGILYITGGSPGARVNAFGVKNDYTAVQAINRRQSFSEVEVTDSSFTITTYYADDMSVLDRFTINKTAFDEQEAVHFPDRIYKTDVNNITLPTTIVGNLSDGSSRTYEIKDLIPTTVEAKDVGEYSYSAIVDGVSNPVDITIEVIKYPYALSVPTATETGIEVVVNKDVWHAVKGTLFVAAWRNEQIVDIKKAEVPDAGIYTTDFVGQSGDVIKAFLWNVGGLTPYSLTNSTTLE